MEIPPTAAESLNYDAGIAAYKRGHYEMAMYDFEQRAEQGDAVAQFCLAFMYKYGMGVPQNFQNAIEWYIKSAEQGYVPAQNDLGVMYSRLLEKKEFPKWEIEKEGLESVIMSYSVKSVERFTEAANQNNAIAQFNLALVEILLASEYPEGSEGYLEWSQQALLWYKKAAEQDYDPAQSELAHIYLLGSYGVPKNHERAMELFIKAATPPNEGVGIYKNGNVLAQHSLGTIYAEGIGVKQNYEEALKWYRKAAAQRYTESQYSLGVMYYKGNGVNRDLKEAANWYQRAAEQGHARSQLNLGRMYKLGKGVSQNSEIASRLTLAAAQQGAAIAQVQLGDAFEKEPNDQLRDEAEAYYWYSLAIQNRADLDASMNSNLAVKVSEALEKVRKLLTKEQRDRIDARVNKWVPRVLHASGTGFYINEKHLLTNAHVLRREDDYGNKQEFDEVRNGLRYVEEKSGSLDMGVDLALLFDARGNQDIANFRSPPVDLGEEIVVYGFPLSHILSYKGNITSGIVSGLMSTISEPHPENRFQHTAPTQKGNSGGPVLDAAGNVVGVVVSALNPFLVPEKGVIKIEDVQNVNFAIKFDVIEDFLQKNNITDYKNPIPVVGKDVDRKDIYEKTGKFSTLISCYVNKGPEPLPLPLEEIGIDRIVQE